MKTNKTKATLVLLILFIAFLFLPASGDSVDELVSDLTNSSKDVRIKAVRLLEETKDPASVKALFVAMMDEDVDVQSTAVRSLAHFIPPYKPSFSAPSPKLKNGAMNAKSEAAKNAAVATLKKLENDKALHAIITASTNSQVDVRLAAVSLLGMIRNPRAVDALITALTDSDRLVRIAAIKISSSIKDVRTNKAFLAALADNDEDIQRVAYYMVKTIKDAQVENLVIEAMKEAVIKCLGGRDHYCSERELTGMIANFVYLGRPETIPFLIHVLSQKGSNNIKFALPLIPPAAAGKVYPRPRAPKMTEGFDIAQLYLNCGQKELNLAAKVWADKNGIPIQQIQTPGGPPVLWGSNR
jgi:hypothetical protein